MNPRSIYTDFKRLRKIILNTDGLKPDKLRLFFSETTNLESRARALCILRFLEFYPTSHNKEILDACSYAPRDRSGNRELPEIEEDLSTSRKQTNLDKLKQLSPKLWKREKE